MRPVNRFALLVLTLALAAGTAVAAPPESAAVASDAASAVSQAVDRFIQREKETVQAMKQYHPMVETYYQATKPDAELGSVPAGDRYYLGRLALDKNMQERFYTDTTENVGWKSQLAHSVDPTYHVRKFFTMDVMPVGFAAMIFPDARGLDRQYYNFQFQRREFLGEVRCLVFQVVPKDKSGQGRFLGRIWVEDKDYNIVRFNGTYNNPPRWKMYFHMDSWRANVQPDLWLPSAVYSEESDMQYGGVMHHTARFKAQTRLWAYDLRHAGRQEEFTQMTVDMPGEAVKDESEASLDWSPVMSLRAWQREAEDNVLERLEKAGLLAPAGQVDKVLETVVNNVEITNNLDLQPEVRCRVLLTSPLETFTVGHTIVISRGMLDVLPDEASLAMVLTHEIAHMVAGEQLDTKYAFGDRMWFADEDSFNRIRFASTAKSEELADARALTLLKNSPYADKLTSAGLFLRQLSQRAADMPNLTTAHIGDGLTAHSIVTRMVELMNSAPELQMRKTDQVAALPLGARIKVNPWDDRVEMLKTKTVTLHSAREKMPFEVAPVVPHLTRINTANGGTDLASAKGANGGN